MSDPISILAGTASIIAVLATVMSSLKTWIVSKKELKTYENIRLKIKQTDSKELKTYENIRVKIKQTDSDVISAIENISLSISNKKDIKINKHELNSAIEHLELLLADVRLDVKSIEIDSLEKSIKRLKPLTIEVDDEPDLEVPLPNPDKMGGRA